MKNSRWMIVFCLLVLAGALSAKQFQIGTAVGIAAFILMMGCCLIPLLSFSCKSSGSCCGQSKMHETGRKEKTKSCH